MHVQGRLQRYRNHWHCLQVKNMEGFTALHWLALRGMDEDDDVEVRLESL